MPIHTLGHSTRTLAGFMALLRAHGVRWVIDVRRYPASRRHPHFTADALASALGAEGLDYRHEPDLGGRRRARPDSPHTAWKSESFRGYADHMDTPAFAAALDRLIEMSNARAAILCAEAVPWNCHRQLIADALVARGIDVLHILEAGPAQPHVLNPSARVLADGRLIYPGQTTLFGNDTEAVP